MHGLAVLALVAPLQVLPLGDHSEYDWPNILIVLADDVGKEMLAVYEGQALVACTPTIDALARRGMVFRNAWSNPLCSPSRAQLLTGRYAFRNGVGSNAGRWQGSTGLSTAELSLPEILTQYQSAWLGKWHLAHPMAGGTELMHPNLTGFDYFAGSLFNLVHGPVRLGFDYYEREEALNVFGSTLFDVRMGNIARNLDYFEWEKTVNGVENTTQVYATTDTANETILAANSLQEPWFIVASFNAPHSPRHEPPVDLVTCEPSTTNVDARLARKMVNALDTELGRVLADIDSDVFVIFMGDNGSSRSTILPPYNPQHSKGTMYEGGIGVPLIVAGPGVLRGDCDQLVSSTDIFATLAELTGSSAYAEDSVSFLSYLGGDLVPRRETVYTERFSPNGYDTDFEQHHQAIRTLRYKLIVSTDAPDEFYDLERDPFERTNLLGGLSSNEQHTFNELRALLP